MKSVLRKTGLLITRTSSFSLTHFSKRFLKLKPNGRGNFELIFVDEYQDTDSVQYRIIKALAEKHLNLRVVGDDDQGSYGFRGANIQNILNFEEDYRDARGAKVITLEQNYRSTQQIVKAFPYHCRL